jgi:hypothetical protein
MYQKLARLMYSTLTNVLIMFAFSRVIPKWGNWIVAEKKMYDLFDKFDKKNYFKIFPFTKNS